MKYVCFYVNNHKAITAEIPNEVWRDKKPEILKSWFQQIALQAVSSCENDEQEDEFYQQLFKANFSVSERDIEEKDIAEQFFVDDLIFELKQKREEVKQNV